MGTRPSWLPGDISAGLAIAAVGLPSATAYPAIAGLPPQTGLYASIAPLVAYAVFGPSRQLIVGPDAATMTVVAAVLTTIYATPGVSADRVPVAALLALTVGVFYVIVRALRLGVLATLLSRPILTGFLAGISLSIMIGQVGRLTGLKIESNGLIGSVLEVVEKAHSIHWPSLALGAAMFVERVSPRVFRVVALPAPSDREKSQMYFQRYMAQLPAAGEVVIFDRSWYNRTGVERVMGFTSENQVRRFLQVVPHLEGLIIESGVILLKYFLDVSEDEQERRFRQRIDDPVRQWKLSAMDLESYRRWWDYTKAYDEMIRATGSPHAPWWIVDSNDKKSARINCITHLLKSIPYERLEFDEPKLGKRQKRPDDYVADSIARNIVPTVF
ncbi:polyphosphate kinase 2 [Rhizobium mesoamericanum]|nr:polyphosphate kinase 2 [Rhizobium mesoamericanum]